MADPDTLAHRRRLIGRMKHVTAVKEDGTWVESVLPGFASLANFNRKMHIDVAKVARYFETARFGSIVDPRSFLFGILHDTPDKTIFTTVMSYEFYRALYRKTRIDAESRFNVMTTLVDFNGKSSVDMMSVLQDADRTNTLAKVTFKYTYVDGVLRKAIPIPDETKQRYKVFRKPDHIAQPFKPKLAKAGQYVHVFSRDVIPGDLDGNYHINNTLYITLGLDCAADATFAGKFKYFHGDVAFYDVKSLNVSFRKECRLGDYLQVRVWEDDVEPLLLHFEIEKEDKVAVQMNMLFYPLENAHL